MATFITPSLVARSALAILEEELVIANLCHRGDTSTFTSAKCGDTITIRKPASFTVDEFSSTINTQTVTEGSVTLTLEKHFDTSVAVTARDQTLSLEDFNEQITRPVMVAFAEKIDTYLLGKYVDVYNITGDETAIQGFDDIAAVVQKLDENRVPKAKRVGFITPALKASLLSMPDFTRADSSGRTDAFRDAMVGRTFGIDWYSTTNISSHTKGVGLGASAAGTGSAGSKTVTIASGTANTGAVKRGDIVTFAGQTQTYVVTSNLTLDSSGNGSLSIDPPLTGALSGALVTSQNCALPNLVGDFSGLTCAVVPLEGPLSPDTRAAVMSYKNVSVRVVQDYSISTKTNVISFDMLVGARVSDPRKLLRWNRK